MDIRDLGRRDEPVLLFGGPYSNLQATHALRAEAQARAIGPENCICTGDVVAYCGDAAATVTEIRDWGCVVVAGNCEKQLAAGAIDCGCGFEAGSACDLLSGSWYAHANAEIGAEARAWMAGCPDGVAFSHRGMCVQVCHGGFSDVSRFLWPVSEDSEFLEELEWLGAHSSNDLRGRSRPDLVVSGHCGLPFERQIDGTRWINAGAIGLPPHDGGRETRFALLEQGKVSFHRLRYDWRSARRSMERRGLTQGYHEALETGWWPSEDVLPQALRRQSVPIKT